MAEEQVNTDSSLSSGVDARREAARLLGQACTAAKAAAARENGKRGGRPKGIPMSAEARRKISEAKRARADRGAELPSGDVPPIPNL